MPKTKDAKRLELRDRMNTQVHTYDWLVDRIRGAISFSGPPASNPNLIQRPDPNRDERGRRG